MKPNIKKLLILNAPYLLFVYLFDKVGQAVRLSPGAGLSGKLLSIGSGFSAAFSNALPSFAPMDLLIGIVGAVVIRLAVYVKGKNAKKYRKGMEYGSARWGNAEDMQSILDAINEWIKEILIGAINGNLSTMFGDVNEKVGTIAAEVGQTPQGWNAGIFSMIQSLSENVIVPIAGLVITYVLCVELISMVTEKNNMHDIDTFMFFKWFFKAWVAVYLVTHTFTITMAVFDMAQHVVSGAAGVIGGDTNIDVDAALSSMQAGLDAMEIPELLLLVMETSLVSLCMKIMSVLITVILYGRMIEIYLYCSVSPIPFATMTNREWGQIGNNYLKSLFALGFQGFLIMICVGIYAVLVNNMIIADNLHSAIFSLAAYTVILCFSLFKSGALAKSIFSAH